MGACSSAKKSNGNRQSYPFKLLIKTSIWTKNQHNLFDFESSSLTKKQFEMENSGKIIQVDQQVFPIGYYEYVKEQIELFKIELQKEDALVKQTPKNQDQISEQNQLWYVVRDQKVDEQGQSQDKRHLLQVGDVIKLGRANLRVKDFVLCDNNNQQEDEQNAPNTEGQDYDEQSFNTGEKHCCRICLSENSNIENPLLRPCECSGSMKFLHLKCIQKWVERQMKTKTYSSFTVYFWKKLRCELCKIPYKTEFQFQDITYNIINIPKPKTSYLMLQLKSADKKQERGIYVIDLSKKNCVKIGRTQECDVKLNDISVSRIHATLNVEKEQLYIEDCGSKFGTLILLQNQLNINPRDRKKYQLQCGRTLVTIECQKKYRVRPPHEQNLIPNDIVIEQMQKEDIEKEQQIELKSQQNIGSNHKGLSMKVFQDSICGDQKEGKGVFISNGKQGVELDDILIYDVDDKYFKSNTNNQPIQSNNVLTVQQDTQIKMN